MTDRGGRLRPPALFGRGLMTCRPCGSARRIQFWRAAATRAAARASEKKGGASKFAPPFNDDCIASHRSCRQPVTGVATFTVRREMMAALSAQTSGCIVWRRQTVLPWWRGLRTCSNLLACSEPVPFDIGANSARAADIVPVVGWDDRTRKGCGLPPYHAVVPDRSGAGSPPSPCAVTISGDGRSTWTGAASRESAAA